MKPYKVADPSRQLTNAKHHRYQNTQWFVIQAHKVAPWAFRPHEHATRTRTNATRTDNRTRCEGATQVDERDLHSNRDAFPA